MNLDYLKLPAACDLGSGAAGLFRQPADQRRRVAGEEVIARRLEIDMAERRRI